LAQKKRKPELGLKKGKKEYDRTKSQAKKKASVEAA